MQPCGDFGGKVELATLCQPRICVRMSKRTGEEQVCNYTLVLECICIGMTAEQEQREGVEENKKRLGGLQL